MVLKRFHNFTDGEHYTKEVKITDKPEYGKPQVFRITRPVIATSEGPGSLVQVLSKDRKWKAELPMTTQMWNFFGEKLVIYCEAKPDTQIGLHILSFLPDQHWED